MVGTWPSTSWSRVIARRADTSENAPCLGPGRSSMRGVPGRKPGDQRISDAATIRRGAAAFARGAATIILAQQRSVASVQRSIGHIPGGRGGRKVTEDFRVCREVSGPAETLSGLAENRRDLQQCLRCRSESGESISVGPMRRSDSRRPRCNDRVQRQSARTTPVRRDSGASVGPAAVGISCGQCCRGFRNCRGWWHRDARRRVLGGARR